MLALAALILAGALCWCTWRLTSRPLRVTVAHSLGAPITLRTDAMERFAERWWTEARTVPIAPVESAMPVRPEDALDEVIEAAVATGVSELRAMYAEQGRPIDEAALNAEARELVLAEFGT